MSKNFAAVIDVKAGRVTVDEAAVLHSADADFVRRAVPAMTEYEAAVKTGGAASQCLVSELERRHGIQKGRLYPLIAEAGYPCPRDLLEQRLESAVKDFVHSATAKYAIARRHGVSVKNLDTALISRGFDPRGRRERTAPLGREWLRNIEIVRRAHEGKLTLTALAEQVGVSRQRVTEIIPQVVHRVNTVYDRMRAAGTGKREALSLTAAELQVDAKFVKRVVQSSDDMVGVD